MGVNSWSPFNKLGFVKARGNLDADLAVIAFPIDDVGRNFTVLSETPYLPAASPPRFALEEVAYHLTWRWRESKRGRRQKTASHRDARGISAYLELAELLESLGTEVIFEVLPGPSSSQSTGPSQYELQIIANLEAAIGDRFPMGYPETLFQNKKGATPLFKDTVHLHTRGHLIYADYFKRRITSKSSRWNLFVGVSSR